MVLEEAGHCPCTGQGGGAEEGCSQWGLQGGSDGQLARRGVGGWMGGDEGWGHKAWGSTVWRGREGPGQVGA